MSTSTDRMGIVALTLAAAAQPLSGQSSSVLAQAGTDSIASFEDLDGRDDGTWFMLVDTSLAPPRRHELRRNGLRLFGEGDALALAGVVIGDGDGQAPNQPFLDVSQPGNCARPFSGILALSDDADALTPPVITADNDRALFFGDEIVLQEGSVTSAAEVAPGTRIGTLLRSTTNAHGDSLVLADLIDPLGGAEYPAVLRIELEGACTTAAGVRQSVLLKRGDVLPGERVLSALAASEKRSFDLNARGDWMVIGAFESAIDRAVVLNGRGVLRETQPIPGGLGAATSLQVASVDLNDLGDYVIQTRTSVSKTVIVKGSVFEPSAQQKFVQAGELVPDPDIGPFVLQRIGNTTRFANGAARNWFPAIVTNSGDVIWYGEWYEGDEVVAAIFVNHKAVVRTGSIQGGALLERLGSSGAEPRYELEASPNGRYLLYEAELGEPVFQDAILRMDLGESVAYGTRAQGCSLPYPAPGLEHVSDDLHPGPPLGFGGFPLRNGQDFFVSVDAPAPPAASRIALVFASSRDGAACGTPYLGTQVLVGGSLLVRPLIQSVAQSVFAVRVPGTVPPDLAAYAQAFFLSADGRVLGGTNGIRFVFGTP